MSTYRGAGSQRRFLRVLVVAFWVGKTASRPHRQWHPPTCPRPPRWRPNRGTCQRASIAFRSWRLGTGLQYCDAQPTHWPIKLMKCDAHSCNVIGQCVGCAMQMEPRLGTWCRPLTRCTVRAIHQSGQLGAPRRNFLRSVFCKSASTRPATAFASSPIRWDAFGMGFL